jgi:hypothetical protein
MHKDTDAFVVAKTHLLRALDRAPEGREACERALNFRQPVCGDFGDRSFMLPPRRGGATTIK